MNRTEIINHLIKTYGYKSYLEIGVAMGHNFEAVQCERKVGVDPGNEYSHITYQMTSDRYFSDRHFRGDEEKFDIIFIDGYHEQFQFYRDVKNALEVLNPGGIIVCHDILPADEHSGKEPGVGSGTCWKGWLDLRLKDELQMRVVDTDCGCGIIRVGQQENPITYQVKDYYWGMITSASGVMNVISVEDFLRLYK